MCGTESERRAINRVAVRRYSQTSEGKAVRKRYQESPRGRAAHRAAVRRYNQSPKGRTVHWTMHLKSKYGLSQEDLDKLRTQQKGCCAICGTNQPKLDVDHNHETGKVRGLLCSRCNLGLGYFEGWAKINAKPIKDYLKTESEKPKCGS